MPSVCRPPSPSATAPKAQMGTGCVWGTAGTGVLSVVPALTATPRPPRAPQGCAGTLGMVAVGRRIPGAGIGPHTFGPVWGLRVQALSTRGAVWVAGPWLLPVPGAALAMPCGAPGSKCSPGCGAALCHSPPPLHASLSAPAPVLPRLSAASPSWCLQQRHLWDPLPPVLLRAFSSVALRWDTVVPLGSSCAREVSLPGG